MTDSPHRYRVLEKLESGGMAEVFRAESEGLEGFKKQVAIKRVLPHLSEKKRFIAMFLDEARLSARLSHSNCVQVFDIGVGDNAFFIVMEFVDGANLKSVAEQMKKTGKQFSVQVATHIAVEICKGLSYAHELTDNSGVPLEIVHRDMSPPNVLITKYGEVKIVDFGLAKASSQLEKSEPGIIKGKFSYLSPEAAMGQEVDLRTDIFAVGIILFELLTGQRLFMGDTDFQTVKKVQMAEVPSVRQINKDVPAELERILLKSLARDPSERYLTARELGQDLTRFLFAFGRPVSTFDLAQIVEGTMREKAKVPKPQGSIIDKLIEEALFEFTSLTDKDVEEKPAAPVADIHRSTLGPSVAASFVDPTNWAADFGLGDVAQTAQNAQKRKEDSIRSSIKNLSEGNLADLEETSFGLPMRSEPPPAPPRPIPPGGTIPPGMNIMAPVTAAAAAQIAPPPEPIPAKKAGNGPVIAVGLLVVVAAAGAAAWFGGVIPH
jgi:serine/threonine protein kinase